MRKLRQANRVGDKSRRTNCVGQIASEPKSRRKINCVRNIQTFAKFLKVIVTLSLFGKIVIVIRYRYLTLRPNNFSLSVSLQKWK